MAMNVEMDAQRIPRGRTRGANVCVFFRMNTRSFVVVYNVEKKHHETHLELVAQPRLERVGRARVVRAALRCRRRVGASAVALFTRRARDARRVVAL